MATSTNRVMGPTASTPMSSVLQLAASCRGEPQVFDGVSPELCPHLEEVILDRMQRDRRRVGSINVGGWKSSEDFFAWPDASVQKLREAICGMIGTNPSISWAMVNRVGSHHPRHQHRASILMGVYYVTVGNEEAIVPTIFECPSDGRALPKDRYELEVEPHPGRLVICRGETWHRVPVYAGELPRITIAFDVRR
jgi:Putative 2OG-Fe(II) oxygenase